MHYNFICTLDGHGVAETDVKIGYKPYDVSNFRCRSYNHENLSCSFEKPFNPVNTKFSLSYNIPLIKQVSKHKKNLNINNFYVNFIWW